MAEWKAVKEGKVREIYADGDRLLMVATDRISAFDVILENQIPGKGKILTQMSKFWFGLTGDLCKNHLLSVNPEDFPPYFQSGDFPGRTMLCRKLEMIPIECIVRGYITGSGWESYQECGKVCGIPLPAGLRECEKLPAPIYTPSTKAALGLHDENISFERSAELLETSFPGRGRELAAAIRDKSLAIYQKCADYAHARGILIADTKFEFGLDGEGNVVLADEVLTPDSSRFWRLETYAPGRSQSSFDKQFVRDWLKAHPGNQGLLPQEVVEKTSALYQEAYRMLAS